MSASISRILKNLSHWNCVLCITHNIIVFWIYAFVNLIMGLWSWDWAFREKSWHSYHIYSCMCKNNDYRVDFIGFKTAWLFCFKRYSRHRLALRAILRKRSRISYETFSSFCVSRIVLERGAARDKKSKLAQTARHYKEHRHRDPVFCCGCHDFKPFWPWLYFFDETFYPLKICVINLRFPPAGGKTLKTEGC